MMVQKGREFYYSDLIPTGNIKYDRIIIPIIIDKALAYHDKNVGTMNTLDDRFFNISSVINKKVNSARSTINNKIAIPYFQLFTRNITSHCFSNAPKVYVEGEEEKYTEQMNEFNKALEIDFSSNTLFNVSLSSGKFGVGYRYIMKPSEREIENGSYFKSIDLDPRTAFPVFSNTIAREQILGVIKRDIIKYDDYGIQIGPGQEFNVFTKWHQWRFEKIGGFYNTVPFHSSAPSLSTNVIELDAMAYELFNDDILKPKESIIPLIPYWRNQEHISDFELAIVVQDTIDLLTSLVLDKVQSNVDYIILAKGFDLGTLDAKGTNKQIELFNAWKEQNIIPLPANQGSNNSLDIDILDIKLSILETQSFIAYLKGVLEEVCFIPSRTGASSGNETKSSVTERNGSRSLDNLTGIILGEAIKSEKRFLECALDIAKTYSDCPFKDLKIKDIKIKPLPKTNEDLITTTQSVSNLYNKVNPHTNYRISNIVADVDSAVKEDEKYFAQQRIIDIDYEGKKAYAIKLAELQAQADSGTAVQQTETVINADNQPADNKSNL